MTGSVAIVRGHWRYILHNRLGRPVCAVEQRVDRRSLALGFVTTALAHFPRFGLEAREEVAIHNLTHLLLSLPLIDLDTELLDLAPQALLADIGLQRRNG